MQEAIADNSFRKAVSDTGKSDPASSLYDCAYDRTAPELSRTKLSGSNSIAKASEQAMVSNSLPSVDIADSGSADVDKRPRAGKPVDSGRADSSPATPAAAAQRPDRAGFDGAMGQAVSGDPLAQKIPEQFQFSKEKTAAAALNMFAKDELDLNGDGFVNKVELSRKHDELEEAAKKNPKSKEILEKQQAVNYMIMDYSKLSSAHDDEFFSESSGITIYDLASTVSSVNKAKR
jgi:hypothetical protein